MPGGRAYAGYTTSFNTPPNVSAFQHPTTTPLNTTAFQHPLGTSNNYAPFSPPYNPYTAAVNWGGTVAQSLAGGQNAAIDAQIRALQGQLLGAGMGGGSGGGGGGGAGIANAIANLQNQMHDIDIASARKALGQIPGLGVLSKKDYLAQQTGLNLQAKLQRLQSTSQKNNFASDATSRGAMSAPGTASTFSSIASTLADQLAGISQQKVSNSSAYQKGVAALSTQADSLRGQMAKLAIQKQIEDQQARAAAASGGGGNPFASLASFMQSNAVNSQIGQLNAQKINPAQQAQQMYQYATLYAQNPQLAASYAQMSGFDPSAFARWIGAMNGGGQLIGSGGKR